MSTEGIRNHAAFIWSVADLLRGDYKQSDYGRVILPLNVIRRLDCVLEPTKAKVLQRHQQLAEKIDNLEPVLQAEARQQFYNTSPLDFRRLLDDPNHLADNLRSYILGSSSTARDVIDKFNFDGEIAHLDRANLLFLVLSRFADIDLHPDAVSNLEMGYLYEELIRRFSELSNETAGEHVRSRKPLPVSQAVEDDPQDQQHGNSNQGQPTEPVREVVANVVENLPASDLTSGGARRAVPIGGHLGCPHRSCRGHRQRSLGPTATAKTPSTTSQNSTRLIGAVRVSSR